MTKIAIITGGAQGIGRGVADHCRSDGWRVFVLDRDAEAIAELQKSYRDVPLLALTADVSDEANVERAFAAIAEWQAAAGEPEGFDLLVNNAGVADPVSGPIEKLALADWRRRQDSHLTAAFLCTRAAVPGLRQRRGSVVNVASTRGLQSEPHCEAYAAAKGGLLALTHALAISLGPDVRVNAVLPGWIETGPWKKSADRTEPRHSTAARTQHPVGRVGTPPDIAAAVAFLTSPGAGFITGQQFVIDGGMTRKMIYAE